MGDWNSLKTNKLPKKIIIRTVRVPKNRTGYYLPNSDDFYKQWLANVAERG